MSLFSQSVSQRQDANRKNIVTVIQAVFFIFSSKKIIPVLEKVSKTLRVLYLFTLWKIVTGTYKTLMPGSIDKVEVAVEVFSYLFFVTEKREMRTLKVSNN